MSIIAGAIIAEAIFIYKVVTDTIKHAGAFVKDSEKRPSEEIGGLNKEVPLDAALDRMQERVESQAERTQEAEAGQWEPPEVEKNRGEKDSPPEEENKAEQENPPEEENKTEQENPTEEKNEEAQEKSSETEELNSEEKEKILQRLQEDDKEHTIESEKERETV